MERHLGSFHLLAERMAAVRGRLPTRPYPQLWLRLGLDEVAAELFDHARFWPGSFGGSVQLAEFKEEW
jgi:hypothetical protein